MENYSSPVYNIKKIPIEKIQANTYNPNHVATPEMKLLYESIKEDGYTMPIVCYYLEDEDKYEIVDGFHRYTTMLNHKDIYKRENGCLPVSIIDKPLEERMASTVRHNRARGSHDIGLMANIVAELVDSGMSDAKVMKSLGMDADELLRLKQVSGLASLFADKDFSKSWDIKNQKVGYFMPKVSESKRKANDKWDKNNKERKQYINRRSVARNFIKNMEDEDVPEFKKIMEERTSKTK